MQIKPSLAGKLTALLLFTAAVGAELGALLSPLFGSAGIAVTVTLLLLIVPLVWTAGCAVRPLRQAVRALHGSVASYRDGDFSFSLVQNRDDELGRLIAAHNELGSALREQRVRLVQRELLLDTIFQNSPVALVLVDPHARVVYANLAARQLLNGNRSLLGADFTALLQRAPKALREAAAAGGDSLFHTQVGDAEETFALSRRVFNLYGRPHHLYLLKALTRELSRQEVDTWKRLIRVLSHELNNSLGPITSMAHTGAEVLRRGECATLGPVFAAIEERSRHLHQFIAGYAAFARLPAPHQTAVCWPDLVADLARHQAFRLAVPLPDSLGWFDRPQLEQALINLLKNAHEAGSAPEHVELAVQQVGSEQRIEVRDRGSGMTQTVLAQALLPFYSTKRTGTGLGLALAREITEAHGGRIHLANREEGGVSAMLILPTPNHGPSLSSITATISMPIEGSDAPTHGCAQAPPDLALW